MDRDLDTLAQAAWQSKVDFAREGGFAWGLILGVVLTASWLLFCELLAKDPPLSGIDDPNFNVALEAESGQPTAILLREVYRELLELRRERTEANEKGDDREHRSESQ